MRKLDPPDWGYFGAAWAIITVGVGFVLIGSQADRGSLLTALGLIMLVYSLRPTLRTLFQRNPRKQLARAYLAECVRPYEDPLIQTQLWSPAESTPAGSQRMRTKYRAPKLLPETKVLLEKVWGGERTFSLNDLGDLQRFLAEVSPKLARKGLLRWRETMLSQITKQLSPSSFSLADHVRLAAGTDLQESTRQRQNDLPALLFLFDRVHCETIITEAM
jgi:hypothetical protein